MIRFTPSPEGLSAEFYAECARGRLSFQRCDDCGAWRHPPRVMCAACGSWKWKWTPSSGRGSIYTWTVTHQPLHPAFADATPYAVVVVEMEEGVRLVSGVIDLPLERLVLGLPVEVVFEKASDSIGLHFFRPRR